VKFNAKVAKDAQRYAKVRIGALRAPKFLCVLRETFATFALKSTHKD